MALAKPQYPALDAFRLVAAGLVVAVHTSPLFSLSPTADFLLTRVLARVAVPFFFLCTGFFTLGATPNAGRLGRFMRKTAGLYLLALVLYQPLMLYNGFYQNGPFYIIKAYLWSGPFYHLWYFPAVLWGCLLCYGLLRFAPGAALWVGVALYLPGLLGNSYAGLLPFALPAEATRNGLFFAPLFLLLGARLAARPEKPHKRVHYGLLALLCLVAMAAEALALRLTGTLQGDVMYLLLPPLMWALFSWLLCLRGCPRPALREISMWVYILHPWVIAALRPVLARLLKSENVMETHSLAFFCAVLPVSFAFGWLAWYCTGLARALRRPGALATAEVSGAALTQNLREMRALVPGKEIIAVVKANAYGHGLVPVARHLQRQGVSWFAVATPAEAVRLRARLWRGNILVLGYTPPQLAFWMKQLCITLTAVSTEHAHALAARRSGVRVHIKVDTGMHRLGALPGEIAPLYKLKGIRVTGIYTHFSCADSLEDHALRETRRQATLFYETLYGLTSLGIRPGMRHLQSSYGVLNHPELECDAVRLGLALYGAVERPTKVSPSLQPALALRATVTHVQRLPAGESVGYCMAHTCTAPTTLAWVGIGYADGIPRGLQGWQAVLRGNAAPVIGKICMDRLCLDITGIPDVQVGDEAALIGPGLDVCALARHANTIPNEILAGIGPRVQHSFSKGSR